MMVIASQTRKPVRGYLRLFKVLPDSVNLKNLSSSQVENDLHSEKVKMLTFIDSIQFSLFPAHINISYNNNNVCILCRKRGRQKTMLMDVRPLTITVVIIG